MYEFKISTTHGYTNMLRNIQNAAQSLSNVSFEIVTPTQEIQEEYFSLAGTNVDTSAAAYTLAYIKDVAAYTLDDFTNVSETGVRSAKSQPEIRQIFLDDVLYAQANPTPVISLEEEEEEEEPPAVAEEKSMLPVIGLGIGLYFALK